jgi:hypothetical protein
MKLLSFFTKEKPVQETKTNAINASGSFAPKYRTHQPHVLDYLNSGFVSYNITYALCSMNTVVSSFIWLISWSLQKIVIVDNDDNEITWPVAKKLLDACLETFGNNKSMREYSYKTIFSYIATGMKVSTPIEVENGIAKKIWILDARKLMIDQTGKVFYNWKEVQSFEKFIVKPSFEKTQYGDCIFTGAVKDAMLNSGILDTSISFYNNKADPRTVYMLWADEWLTQDQVDYFTSTLVEKYQWTYNDWLPLSSNIVKDVKTIDASAWVIKSIDQRLYASNTLSMALNVDLRALGWMRDWGSQAEMTEVYNQVNTVIDKRAELMSENLTSEFNKMVANSLNYRFKFIPKYYSSKQAKIDNCLNAYSKWIGIDEERVLDLIYNS